MQWKKIRPRSDGVLRHVSVLLVQEKFIPLFPLMFATNCSRETLNSSTLHARYAAVTLGKRRNMFLYQTITISYEALPMDHECGSLRVYSWICLHRARLGLKMPKRQSPKEQRNYQSFGQRLWVSSQSDCLWHHCSAVWI